VILVDTSVLIDYFRGAVNGPVERLALLLEEGADVRIPAVCCQELLQGARDEDEWRLLESYLTTQELVVPGDPVAAHLEAARIYFDCRRRGVTVRSTLDCYIAQLALERDALLLHNDEDFVRIAEVRPLKQ
jgi:predicted nucleic acid-binding protein